MGDRTDEMTSLPDGEDGSGKTEGSGRPPGGETLRDEAGSGAPVLAWTAVVLAILALGASGGAFLVARDASRAGAVEMATRADLAKAVQRVGRLEERMTSAQAPVVDEAIANAIRELEQTVGTLKVRVEAAVPPQPNPRVVSLESRMAAAEAAVEAGQKRSEAMGGQIETLAGLRSEIAELRQRVEAPAVAPADVAEVRAGLDALTKRLDTLHSLSTTAEALVLAAGQLRMALTGDQPFAPEYKAARALGGGDATVAAALDVLAPYAETGIPTRSQLAARFAPLAGDVVRAADRGEGGTWIDQVEGAVSSLVTIRRQGAGVMGTAPSAIAARAEAALANGNIVLATRELEMLEGPAAAVVAPWMTQARARVAAEEAARALGDRAVAMFSAIGGAETAR